MSKLFGFEVRRIKRSRVEKVELEKCQHENVDASDLSAGIYYCRDCSKPLIYVNQELTPLTLANSYQNDKGEIINGIHQF